MAEWISAVFATRSAAETAVDRLETLGYKRGDVSVLMNDNTRAKDFADDTGTSASANSVVKAAKTAATVGGALAAIIAGAAAVKSFRSGKNDDSTTYVVPDQGVAPLQNDYTAASSFPATGDRMDQPERSDRPFIAGPLAAILLPSLGAGIVSLLRKAGIPKDHVERYEQGLNAGGIVVGVSARSGDEAALRDILRDDAPGHTTP